MAKRSNFPGRRMRRRYVAGLITAEQFKAGIDSLPRGTKTTKAAPDRDPKLLDLPRRLLGAL